MKNKKLLTRINTFIEKSHENEKTHRFIKGRFYYTENPPLMDGDDRYWGKKYFFCYCNTHSVLESFKTQAEIEEFLAEYGF